MRCSLNSLQGVISGSIIGFIQGDTRSLDYLAGELVLCMCN